MKKKFIIFVSIQITIFVLIAVSMIVVDPYFHYHDRVSGLSYQMIDERYINNGISRNFNYSGLIIGTSMTQNFKPSEASASLNREFVKTPYAGAGFKELANNIQIAIDANDKLDTVIMSLDYLGLRRDKDYVAYSDVPTYMYDDNLWNDTQYIFNKDILYHGLFTTLINTIKKNPSTTFDEYSTWYVDSGFEHIMESYDRESWKEDRDNAVFSSYYFMDTELQKAYDNINQNIIPIVENNPDVTFYFFYSPHCILWWDSLDIQGTIEMQIEAERQTSQMLLQFDNVKIFSFFENIDLICNMDLYQNKEHYIAEVNSMILQWMANDQYRITKDNLDEHIEKMYEIYTNFDYEDFYQSQLEKASKE